MTITEVALLRIVPGRTIQDADLRSNLAFAKDVMHKYTSNTFYYYQQTEDPSYIYVIGEWESLDQHMNHFIPSADNQALLQRLKDQLTVEWLLHANVAHADLPLPKSEGEVARAREGKSVVSLGRYFVKEGRKEDFKNTFDVNQVKVQELITEGSMGGGWRVDKESGKEEWFLMCPYASVEQGVEIAKTEGFRKFAQIEDCVDGAEIKHAKLLDI